MRPILYNSRSTTTSTSQKLMLQWVKPTAPVKSPQIVLPAEQGCICRAFLGRPLPLQQKSLLRQLWMGPKLQTSWLLWTKLFGLRVPWKPVSPLSSKVEAWTPSPWSWSVFHLFLLELSWIFGISEFTLRYWNLCLDFVESRNVVLHVLCPSEGHPSRSLPHCMTMIYMISSSRVNFLACPVLYLYCWKVSDLKSIVYSPRTQRSAWSLGGTRGTVEWQATPGTFSTSRQSLSALQDNRDPDLALRTALRIPPRSPFCLSNQAGWRRIPRT